MKPLDPRDGGTAFPSHEHFIADREQGGERKVVTGKPHGGMSLRDYFAAKALVALPIDQQQYLSMADGITGAAHRSRVAYMIADAMLTERQK